MFSTFAQCFKSKQKNSPLETLGGEIDSALANHHGSARQTLCEKKLENVGGQAVIDGIMMRHKNHYALAMRLPSGNIYVEHKKWYSFTSSSMFQKPLLRGFPMLVETMINGVKTLNRSAEISSLEEEKPLTKTQLLFTMLFAIGMAIALFVVLPHSLSFFMQKLELGGGVDSFSFQVWDGLFKFLVFFLYLFSISLLPDIRRVFQFHGAEHKVIAAYEENKQIVDIGLARNKSRLHPRCGTTFMLFVLTLAIVVHTILLPPLLYFYAPESNLTTHIVTVIIKILLIIPVSSLAYELIRKAAKLDGFLGTMLKAPGLFLQYFTTIEPTDEHLEVALVALKVALGNDTDKEIITPLYTISD